MTSSEGCGWPTMPDASGLCNACLAAEWSELQRRASIWDPHGLRASVDEHPLPQRVSGGHLRHLRRLRREESHAEDDSATA